MNEASETQTPLPDPTPPPPPSGGHGKRIWATLAALTVSVTLLAWALKDVEFHAFVNNLRNARLGPILLGVALATSLFPLRVFRWSLLLRRPDGERLSWRAMWHSIAMGFMANNLLPFRIGEVVRTVAVSRLGRVSFGAAFSSIAVERIFDGLALVFLLTVALFLTDIPVGAAVSADAFTRAATIGGILSGGALVAAVLVVVFPRPAERLIELLIRNDRWSSRLVGILEDLRHGMQALRSPARVLGVVLWSVTLWLINGASFYVMFWAFDIPINFAGALLMQGVLALGIAAPSAPGYVGVFEAAIKLVLVNLYGLNTDQVVAYALTYHITTFIPITLLGLWSVAKTGVGLTEMRRAVAAHE